MKNICIFIKALSLGGAEQQAIYLAKSLQPSYNVYLVILKGRIVENKYKQYIKEHNIIVIPLKGPLLVRIIKFYNIIRAKKTDIIFSYLASNNFWGVIISKLTGIKNFIGGIRNSTLDKNKIFIQRIIHNKFSRYTIFNNYSGIENLTNLGFNPGKCVVIPNCSIINKNYQVKSDNYNISIITVGRFVKQKDLFTSINSLSYLINNYSLTKSSIKCRIIGYGKLEGKIRKFIASKKLEKFIEIIIKPDNIDYYYANSDIYLCTSLFEGLSNTIMEAMGYGLPIIATDVGDNNRLVKDTINGYLVKVGDYENIAYKLYKLISSVELRKNFGKESYKIINKDYTFKKFKINYYDFINSL